jgi:L-2-hydroxyglutarate oxidase
MVEIALSMQEGSKLFLETEVISIDKGEESSTIHTSKGAYEAEYLVFCAGLQADRLAKKGWCKFKRESRWI